MCSLIYYLYRCSAGSGVETAEPPIISNPEQEGKNWWAGFILKMTSGLHEWMGSRTREAANVSPWMQLKSRGGAYMPSPEFIQFLEMAEVQFNKVNGKELSRERNPIGKVSALLRTARPHIDSEIIEAYSRARFYLRLNDLNSKLMVKEKQQERRKAVHKNKYI